MNKILQIDDSLLKYQRILDYKIPYFELKEKKEFYLYLGEKDYAKIDKMELEKNLDIYIPLKNVHEKVPMTFIMYKNVHKIGDKYYSYYDKNYEYKIGEVMKPTEYGDGYLYVSTLKNLENASYSNERDRAVLKCEIKIEDLETLDFHGNIRTKELKVLEIIDVKDNQDLPF